MLRIAYDLGILDPERRGCKEFPSFVTGKVVFVTQDQINTQKNIYEAAKREKDIVIAVGGDHSISFGLIKAFSEKFKGRRGLLWLDAHSDCEDDFIPPSHEGVLRAVVEEKFVDDVLVLGYRIAHTEEEKKFIKENRLKNYSEANLLELKKFLDENDYVYVSLDIDVLDPSVAPGTGWPEVDGWKEEELFKVLKLVKESGKMKAFDLVEVCPKKDVNEKTVEIAKKIINEITSH